MKVLHILGELKFSGAEVMLKSARGEFQDNDIFTYILSTGEKEIGNYAEELRNSGYKIHHIPFKRSFGFSIKILLFFKKNKFDVVHIHTERFFFFYIVLARLAGVRKLFRTIHSSFDFKGVLKKRRRLFLNIGLFLGCKYIAISKNVQDNERLENGIDSTLINNWIDTNYFSHDKKEFSLGSAKLSFISVGACTAVKQHNLILNLISLLVEQGLDVHYWHIGCGPLEDEEKKICDSLGIQKYVEFLGTQSGIAPFLKKSDFFLMPSRYEGLGNACLEAMATGSLPIVNSVPGLRDLVSHNHDGLVVDFSNTEAVAQQIIELNKNEKQQQLMKFNGRSKIEENYGISNVKKQIDLYRVG